MTVLAFLAFYALMMWLVAFWIGMHCVDDKMDEFEWLMVSLWPAVLVTILMLRVGYLLSLIWNWSSGKPAIHAIQKTLYRLSLVFQPYVLGKRFDGWLRSRKNKKLLEEKKDQEFPKGADCHGKY